MPGQLTDYVRVGSFLVEVSDEGATGEVAACNVAKAFFLFFTSLGIDESHTSTQQQNFGRSTTNAYLCILVNRFTIYYDT